MRPYKIIRTDGSITYTLSDDPWGLSELDYVSKVETASFDEYEAAKIDTTKGLSL